MIKLLRAGFMRYMKNKVFWLLVAITAGLAIFFGINYGGGYSAMAEFVVFAVLLTWVIGREQGDGMFHNKILAGYTRAEIYFSELILGCGACAFLFFIFALIYACLGYRIEDVSAATILELFLGSLLANLVMAALLVALACRISNRYAAVVICILLTIGMSILSTQIRKPATTRKYRTETYTVTAVDMSIDEDGNFLTPGTYEREVPNEAWVGEPVYTICVFLYNILPAGQMQEYEEAGGIWIGTEGTRYEKMRGGIWVAADDIDSNISDLHVFDKLMISEEDVEEIQLNIVYGLITLPVVCAGGWLGFRRKEFV